MFPAMQSKGYRLIVAGALSPVSPTNSPSCQIKKRKDNEAFSEILVIPGPEERFIHFLLS